MGKGGGIAILVFAALVVGQCGGSDEERHTAAQDRRQETSADGEPASAGRPKPTSKPAPKPKPKPGVNQGGQRPKPTGSAAAASTYLVAYVVDGDTLALVNGESVRLVGIDAPERGQCGSVMATDNLSRLVAGQQVRLTAGAADDRDRYGRLLRYVDIGDMDAGLRLIKNGFAIARYDSRDGYGHHPREERYVAADRATGDFRCPAPPGPQPFAGGGGGCGGYSPCIPSYPPDLDCPDVNGPISVTGPDPHGLDGDGDGVACEWG